MDPFTFPRMRTLKFCCAAFVLIVIVAGLPSSAQNGRSTGTSTQAELHISVTVAPVILTPRRDRHDDDDKNEGLISYHLGAQGTQLSITKEVRPMLVSANGIAEKQPVQLTTVVVQ